MSILFIFIVCYNILRASPVTNTLAYFVLLFYLSILLDVGGPIVTLSIINVYWMFIECNIFFSSPKTNTLAYFVLLFYLSPLLDSGEGSILIPF
jgi:hypothetical protein